MMHGQINGSSYESDVIPLRQAGKSSALDGDQLDRAGQSILGRLPHTAFINGIPIEHGSVTQNCNKKSSTFSVAIPKNYPGAMSLIGGGAASIFVSCAAGAGELISGMLDTVDVDFIGTYIRVTGRDLSGQLHQTKISQKFQNLARLADRTASCRAGRAWRERHRQRIACWQEGATGFRQARRQRSDQLSDQ